MTRRLITASGIVGVVAIVFAAHALRAANVVTLTQFGGTGQYSAPVGIDWLPATNELLVSDNYPGGLPSNFIRVDRSTAVPTVFAPAIAAWENEIYFASVRPNSPSAAAGWKVGYVYTAKGNVDPACIAELDPTGAVTNGCFAFLPGKNGTGETKLKRGAVKFDYVGVASGDLLIIASDPEYPPSTVYRIDHSGTVTMLAEITDQHAEGIATIPNDPKYGPWAGKLVVGEEYIQSAEAIPLNCVYPCAGGTTRTNLGVEIEDIWVVPADSAFYGVDYNEGQPAKLWTADSNQWTNFVGRILLATEHTALLNILDWNGSSFVPTLINDGSFSQNPVQAVQWEHITFAPNVSPAITIVKLTNGTNNDAPPGILLPVGSLVTWSYVVTNTGNETLIDVVVTDDHGVAVSCPKNTLATGESMTCTGTGSAILGQYTNVGSVVGTGKNSGKNVTASNPDNYFGQQPGVSIVKYTNDQDANDPNGTDVPSFLPGSSVTWTYKVTNTGNVSIPKANVVVTDNDPGVTPAFDHELTGNGDASFDPGEVWLFKASGTSIDLTLPPPSGVQTKPNTCTANGTLSPSTAYTNIGTVTIPGATASDPSSYCQPPQDNTTPCPAGSFTFSYTNNDPVNGDLVIVFDQFPAPNDNTYGIGAVGWAKGHKFSDLVGSDHAGFDLRDPGGTVKLDFYIDYITANPTGKVTPSGYSSLGPFGGDGKVLVGTLTSADLTWDTSLARNMNNLGYFSGNAQTVGKATAGGTTTCVVAGQSNCALLTIDSPPAAGSGNGTSTDYTYKTPNPWTGSMVYPENGRVVNGWDFHDTYFVTIKRSKLNAIGFDASTWTVEPDLAGLHNSPAKPCPAATGGGACNLSVGVKTAGAKQVAVTVANNASTDAVLSALSLTWPSANGKLMQVKFDGDIVYDSPDIAWTAGGVTLGAGGSQPLVTDTKKKTIQHGTSDVIYLIFEKNVDTNLSHYSATAKFGSDTTCVITLLP